MEREPVSLPEPEKNSSNHQFAEIIGSAADLVKKGTKSLITFIYAPINPTIWRNLCSDRDEEMQVVNLLEILDA